MGVGVGVVRWGGEMAAMHGWPGTLRFRDGLLQAWWARNVPGARR